MDFNLRVKELCKTKGILLKDLARRLDITPTGLSKTLGQKYPQLQSLERIANALEVNVSDLFADEPKATITCPHCGKQITINVE